MRTVKPYATSRSYDYNRRENSIACLTCIRKALWFVRPRLASAASCASASQRSLRTRHILRGGRKSTLFFNQVALATSHFPHFHTNRKHVLQDVPTISGRHRFETYSSSSSRQKCFQPSVAIDTTIARSNPLHQCPRTQSSHRVFMFAVPLRLHEHRPHRTR